LADLRAERGIDSLDSISYPPMRRSRRARIGAIRAAAPGPASRRSALRCSTAGVGLRDPQLSLRRQLVFNEDMAAAFARAINAGSQQNGFDRDPRLRASMSSAAADVDYAVDEIERLRHGQAFVQILVLAMGEIPRTPALLADFAAAERATAADRLLRAAPIAIR